MSKKSEAAVADDPVMEETPPPAPKPKAEVAPAPLKKTGSDVRVAVTMAPIKVPAGSKRTVRVDVVLNHSNGARWSHTLREKDDGVVTFQDVPPGLYTVSAQAHDSTGAHVGDLIVSEQGEAAAPDPTADIEVSVPTAISLS